MRFFFLTAILLVFVLEIQSYNLTIPARFQVALKTASRERIPHLVIVNDLNLGYNNLGLQQGRVDGPVLAAGIATAAQVPVAVTAGLSSNVSIDGVDKVKEGKGDGIGKAIVDGQPDAVIDP